MRFPLGTADILTAAKALSAGYEHIHVTSALAGGLLVSTNYLAYQAGGFVAVATNTTQSIPQFYLDPADHAITGLTTNLRVRALVATNATAPTGTWTMGLYPVTAVGGGLGNFQIATVTSPLGTCTVVTPGASSNNSTVSADFAFPTAGAYVFGLTVSANQAANSAVNVTFMLQKHYT